MFQRFSKFIKPYCGCFRPVWKWEVSSKTKITKRYYRKIVSICRTSQYILAVLATLVLVSFERSRQKFLSSIFRNGLSIFLIDIFASIILGYMLGLKRFPVNYISLIIIKTFIALEDKFKPELHNFTTKVLGQSQFHGTWIGVAASTKTTPVVVPVSFADSYLRSTGIVVAWLGAFWIVRKYTNVDVSKYKISVLISLTVVTSLAAVLLFCTFAFDAIPEIKETHRKLCELWIILGVTTIVFTFAYLFEHLQASRVRGKRKFDFNSRIEWEAFIFVLVFSITIRYLPVIHKEFSARDVLSNKFFHLLEWCIPRGVLKAWYVFYIYANEIGEKTAELLAG